MATRYRIAVIPGDGIGKEVMSEGQRVLERSIERLLVAGPRTRDLGGRASTTEVGHAIANMIEVV
jgi:isocitrate/isopropylmalate dehydrogenase